MILYDLLSAQPTKVNQYHGGGEYIKRVFVELLNESESVKTLAVCMDKENSIDDWISKAIKEFQIPTFNVKNADDILRVIGNKDNQITRFFTGMVYPYSRSRFPDFCVAVGVVHGFRSLEKPFDTYTWRYARKIGDHINWIYPLLFPRRVMKRQKESMGGIFENFDILITVSKHSAYTALLNFPSIVNENRLHVLHTPAKYAREVIFQEEGILKDDYIMMVSANRWEKNSFRGVVAIDNLYQSGLLKGVKTRVYGSLPLRIQKLLVMKENFEFHDYVSTQELEEAYCGCKVFFYPSLNEGFGLPPLEAMKYGKTCVISAVCSLPEVYENSVYYCNPYDIMEMGNRILQACENPIPLRRIEERLETITEMQEKHLKSTCRMVWGN